MLFQLIKTRNMDKRSKESLRRYKKSRQQSSSDSSSSSESDSSGSSYSSSDSERHRRKKARQTTAGTSRRSSSSSTEERRKREKREHCQKKLEAKRIHLKRKLKEAKLKKRAAAAAAALSGHIGHRSLSPTTQAKLKKLAERKHQRAASKERREREREKHRAAVARERERERDHHRTGSRSPTKITKIRIHQDIKRQKSPPRMHHTMMSREKIIIQTRTRERTPSPTAERQRHDHKMRHEELVRERERRDRERERAEREAARDKERAEALARCQERQRERERLAREKLRREEEEKKYVGISGERGERLLPRPAERELAMAASRGYNSRERSLEAIERSRHMSKRELDAYEREREYMEAERRTLLNRDDLRREREYLPARRRELSPVGEHYSARLRDPRDVYPEEDRDRVYNRAYIEEAHHGRERENAWPREIREREIHDLREARDQRDNRDPRNFREMEHELIYPDERERLIRNRERVREEWKGEWDASREQEWNDTPPITGRGGFVGGPKRNAAIIGGGPNSGPPKLAPREQRALSEPDWDTDEVQKNVVPNISKADGSSFGISSGQRDAWGDHDHLEIPPKREKPIAPPRQEGLDRRWQNEWRDDEETMQRVGSGGSGGNVTASLHHHRSERGGRNFRRGGGGAVGPDHADRNAQGLRMHPPPLMTLPVQPPVAGFLGGNPRFPNKSKMTYTNPNLIKKQHAAVAAAKAAAQASAVAAASTAVAAAKAAAQSAANATTNPSILGQATNLIRQQNEPFIIDDKPESGELLHETDGNKKLDGTTFKKCDNFSVLANPIVNDGRASGELSEISDSDDDILNKGEKKSRTETDDDSTIKVDGISEQEDFMRANDDAGIVDDKHDDDEMLDFEEISDGELEEDSRNKGVGDALGVDWASLIAETKLQAENAAPGATEQLTTAKQKWQPHRIILEMGISLCMAGENYAQQLLNESKQKLAEELKEINQKTTDLKTSDVAESKCGTKEDLKNTNSSPNIKEETVPQKSVDEIDDISFNLERLQSLACLQVGERMQRLERQKLILNACGAHSRALSARQDLKLRRQMCNLPAREYGFSLPVPINAKIKARALAAFQRTLEVK
ncbi:fl(2)d-associated complex component-like isoform X2 [Anastrepha obliqua]|uniref:fl(2)d-associated complex component-like isoform X2 n=1 Tax=Anastrepha obliqua TaxID=95512 RepID=UPI002409FB24|nr:fl(2)d-associated complex component-like isoform X2 [Anastrepha obliqua]